jgi:hypothetical protein
MRNAFTLAGFAVVACLNGAAIQAADDAPIQAGSALAIQDAPWFKKADKDGDGKLSRTEFWNPEVFAKVDVDNDAFATPTELRVYYAKNPPWKKQAAAQPAKSNVAPTSDARTQRRLGDDFTKLDVNADGKVEILNTRWSM